VRDIDDWMFHFERRAASRLRKLFSKDLGELPHDLAARLERLGDLDSKPEGSKLEAGDRATKKPPHDVD
jgi:hypothetical protein